MNETEPAIGIIGGSGLYHLPGITEIREILVTTPFGSPSSAITKGLFAGRPICFLPRHGQGHRLAPHEINHRANIWALRSVGVRWIICVAAVGSLKEEYPPSDIVLPDQYFDRTNGSHRHTFFGEGVVAHIAFAEPVSTPLRDLLHESCKRLGKRVHNGGTYVNIEGPAFSTQAESLFYRTCGFDVIGMTNLPEAKLAREAEIALATLALITDYDCWKTDTEHVTADRVAAYLNLNVQTAREILSDVIPHIPTQLSWPEHHSLDHALVTPKAFWPKQTVDNLGLILDRFLIEDP